MRAGVCYNDAEGGEDVIEPGSKLVMVGDSITDCGRAHPVGEAPRGGLGNGYVALVDAHLQVLHPDWRIRVVNVGTSGNTVADVARRWEDEVMALQPDYVSLMIGMNDVWRQFDMPLVIERHVGIDEYRDTLRHLVAKTKPRVRGMFLLSPFYLTWVLALDRVHPYLNGHLVIARAFLTAVGAL